MSTEKREELNESFIGRFDVPIGDKFHTFKLSGDPTSVGSRNPEGMEFWAVVTPGQPGAYRTFLVVGTGHPLPPGFLRVWGHAYVLEGRAVWHLVEYPSPAEDASQ